MDPKRVKIFESVTIGVGGITIALVLARFYFRVIRDRRRALEEWLILACAAMYMVVLATTVLCFQLLPKATSPGNVHKLLTYLEIGPWFYIGAIFCSRIAIGLFHVQLTEGIWINNVARATVWVLVALWPINYAIYAAECPIRKRISSSLTAQCPPRREEWEFWVASATHILSDLVLLIIPFPAVLKLHDRGMRLAVGGVYAIGIVSLSTSVARVVLMAAAAHKKADAILMQGMVEVGLHIMVATMPGISGVFVKRYMVRKEARRISGTSEPTGAAVLSSNTSKDATTGVPVVIEVDQLRSGMEPGDRYVPRGGRAGTFARSRD